MDSVKKIFWAENTDTLNHNTLLAHGASEADIAAALQQGYMYVISPDHCCKFSFTQGKLNNDSLIYTQNY